jgi:hypothetical protein
LLSPASFARYPAAAWPGRWRVPDVRRGQARLFRTVLRSEGVGPPDFAGRFKVVTHGCGAGMTCPLFVDLKTGKVIYLPGLKSVEWGYDQADEIGKATGIDDVRLVYHRASRLLVAVGTRNETPRLAGVTLYDWRDGVPALIRFVPRRTLCPVGGG